MCTIQMVSTTLYSLKAVSLEQLPLWEPLAEQTFQGQGKLWGGFACPDLAQGSTRDHVVFTVMISCFVSTDLLANFASKKQKFGLCWGRDSWSQCSVCIGSLRVWVISAPLDCCFCSVESICICLNKVISVLGRDCVLFHFFFLLS